MHNLTKALLLHCNAVKSFEKYCLEEQRESGQALQFPGAKAFGGFTIKSFFFASFATERSYDKRGKTIKVRINSEQVSNMGSTPKRLFLGIIPKWPFERLRICFVTFFVHLSFSNAMKASNSMAQFCAG